MGKYRVKKQVAVVKGNKVTVYEPSDELVNFDDETAATFGEDVEKAGQDEPEKPVEEQVPADTADTQAATASRKKTSN